MYDLTSSIKTLFNDTVKYNIGYALYTWKVLLFYLKKEKYKEKLTLVK